MQNKMRFADSMPSRLLLLAFLLISSLLLSACVSKVDERDRFNSTSISSPAMYVQKGLCSPINSSQPCICMICTNNTKAEDFPDNLKKQLAVLFDSKVIEATLANSQCHFTSCNESNFKKTLEDVQTDGAKCVLEDGITRVPCFPRFFMLGQGASSGEFSLAQRYCDGRLTMAVIWATSKNNQPPKPPDLPEAPAASQLSCYIMRNQLPVIVYSAGSVWDATTTQNFTDFARTYAGQSTSSIARGPVVLTTEAMLNPYDNYTGASRCPAGADWCMLINSTKLRKVADQIAAFKAGCPDCLIALSLAPTLYSNGVPDVCATEYFLASPGNPADPSDFAAQQDAQVAQDCAPLYDDPSILNSRGQNALSIDLVGIGFILNERTDIASHSAEGAMGQYKSFSLKTLNLYKTPSIWYAVGISPGATLTPATRFSESDVAGVYNNLLGEMSALSSAGVIGVAPYRFLDDETGLPRECKVAAFSFTSTASSLEEVKGPDGAAYSSLHDLANAHTLVVDRVISTNSTDVLFATNDSFQYDARLENGQIQIYERGCQYGFRTVQGALKQAPLSAWFSSCQYYYTNTVATDGKNPPAGADTAVSSRALQIPLIFSANGQGGVCSGFSTQKMYQRVYSGLGGDPSLQNITPPTDPLRQKQLLQLQCGICASNSPMPAVFCDLSSRLPPAAIAFPKAACTQYPQMDDVFLNQRADPVLMRAIASAESGLGKTVPVPAGRVGDAKLDPVGSDAPACAIQFGSDATRCNSAQKSLASLQTKANTYCADTDISANYKPTAASPNACGLGVMRCTDWPGSYAECGGANYNPFNPSDSACCGTHAFLAYYDAAFQKIGELELANPKILQEVAGNEPWYALLLASYAYRGVQFPADDQTDALWQYNNDPNKQYPSFAEYVWAVAKSHYPAEGDYGIEVVRRYNKAIARCGGGCAVQACASSSGGSGDTGDGEGGGDDTGEIILP